MVDGQHSTLRSAASRRLAAVAAAVIGLALLAFSPAALAAANDITTVAGDGANGYGGDGGAATSAQMMAPAGVTRDRGLRLGLVLGPQDLRPLRTGRGALYESKRAGRNRVKSSARHQKAQVPSSFSTFKEPPPALA